MNKSIVNQSLINGIASDFLSVNDRAIHYGDGVFETVLCDVQNVNTRRLFYWQQHYQRLKSSADKLKISCPSESVFLADIAQLLDENVLDENGSGTSGGNANFNGNALSIKIILTRGESERGYLFSKKADSNRIVQIASLDAGYSSLLSSQLLSGDLCFCEQQVSINKNLAGLKHLNRLENVMARNEWGYRSTETNIIDGLMLNANQHVIEGCMSNLFAVKNNELLTPDLNLSGVNGVMREAIIDLANKNNIKLIITNFKQKDLFDMDELFITNSLIGLKSITRLEKTEYKQKKITITMIIFDQLINTMNDYVHAV